MKGSVGVAVGKSVGAALSGSNRSGGADGIPPTGLIRHAPYPGLVDTIGLSIAEFWAACPVEHRTLYSADGSEFYDDATIIANIEASAELNNGGELVGNETEGYAQYADGTAESVLRRAYSYLGVVYAVVVVFGGESVTFGGDPAVTY